MSEELSGGSVTGGVSPWCGCGLPEPLAEPGRCLQGFAGVRRR